MQWYNLALQTARCVFTGRETPQYVPNRFQPVDFHNDNLNATLLDFFTYNPVDHHYPRLGVTSLNTKNKEVIAAILQSALKKDVDASPPNPLPTVAPSEAAAAAQAIFDQTTAQPRPDKGGHWPADRRRRECNWQSGLHRRGTGKVARSDRARFRR
jgi:hypothetical protein